MDTTATGETAMEATPEQLVDRLASVDAAEAPAVADDLARLLAMSLEDSARPHQMEAEFDEAADR